MSKKLNPALPIAYAALLALGACSGKTGAAADVTLKSAANDTDANLNSLSEAIANAGNEASPTMDNTGNAIDNAADKTGKALSNAGDPISNAAK